MLKEILDMLDKCNNGGEHSWSAWVHKSYSLGHYDQEEWEERTCINCGKVEQRSTAGNEDEEYR